MERGAVVANPHRYTAAQFSALQFYYDQVARLGPDAVATEYDNDPPAEAGPVESGITAHRVQRQLSGFDRLTIPPKCVLLTGGIDDLGDVGLDWHGISEFHRRVYELTRRIPPGETRTYGEVAAELGDKNLARAVGQALACLRGGKLLDAHGRIIAHAAASRLDRYLQTWGSAGRWPAWP